MSILEETAEMPRRTMTLFYIIDTSGSMDGAKIEAVNTAIEECRPIIEKISQENADAEIKLAALNFANNAKWEFRPTDVKDVENFSFSASGLTSFRAACEELNSKLSKSEFMKSASGSYAPAFILMSDGEPTDNYKPALDKLWQNGWFKSGVKVAIAISDDTNKEMLAEFTGNKEAVFEAHNIEQLKQIIRMVSVTSSTVASSSSTSVEKTKQEQVIEQVQQEVDNSDVFQGDDAQVDDFS